ncbi:MAG: hypothetical protein AAF367_06925 [Pseudomonadota bacterium]
MAQEKRLSLSFGDFSCDIVGYDDPFTILNKVMELCVEVSHRSDWAIDDHPASDPESRGRFAASLAETAREFDMDIEDIEGKFVVSRSAIAALSGEAEAANDAAPAFTVPSEPVAKPEAAEVEPQREQAPEVVVADELAADEAVDTTPVPQPEVAEPEVIEAEPIAEAPEIPVASEQPVSDEVAADTPSDTAPITEAEPAAEAPAEPVLDEVAIDPAIIAEAGPEAIVSEFTAEAQQEQPALAEEQIARVEEDVEVEAIFSPEAEATPEIADEVAPEPSMFAEADHEESVDKVTAHGAPEDPAPAKDQATHAKAAAEPEAEIAAPAELAADATTAETPVTESLAEEPVAEMTEPTTGIAKAEPAAADAKAATAGEPVVEDTTEATAATGRRKRLRLSIAELVEQAESGAIDETDDNKEDSAAPARVEAKAKPEAPAPSRPAMRKPSPRITIDRARSRPHGTPVPAAEEAEATPAKGSATPRTDAGTAAISPPERAQDEAPLDLTADLTAPAPDLGASDDDAAGATAESPIARVINEVKALSEAKTPARNQAVEEAPLRTAPPEEAEDENFLFGEEPAEEVAPAPEAEEPVADPVELTIAEEVGPAEINEASEVKAKKKSLFGLSLFRRKADAAAAEDQGAADADEDEISDREKNAFARLREAAEADLPMVEGATRPVGEPGAEPRLFSISDGSDFDDANSPAAFARQVGASSLQDLLEASAAYVAIVQGKAKFSRRDVMHALSEIGPEKDYSQEARLKSFRRLVTNGALVPSEDGMFAISHATRYGYENQLKTG